MNKKILICCCLLCGISSCSKKDKEEQFSEIEQVTTIDLQSFSITKDEIPDILKLEFYISLSNELPLEEIERVMIDGGRIFILDNQPKIVCYDMQGNLLYKIDNRGAGPMEYDNIKDFGIDNVTKKLVVFDNFKRKLFYYDISTGRYKSNISINYIAPTELGVIDGKFFFKNIDHSRFEEQKNQMFYLLYSDNGKQVDKMFLPHDAIADFNFDLESFFYSESRLLFIKPFDNIIYLLKSGQITPLYNILLPNQLPMKKIEEKMNHWEIPTSGYAYGLDAAYVSDKILHFTFSKDGFVNSCFYDLSSDKVLFCGPRVLGNARKNLPCYSLINGVYHDSFFALISPSSITERSALHPEYFPKELWNIDEESNPVIAFFKVHQESK